MTLKVLDLFSGIGGFSLGLERTGGFKTVQFCEINEFSRKVLEKNWPDVPVHNDVRTIKPIPADIITGGFPCQDISVAGYVVKEREGIDGERSGLWSEFCRLIGDIRPRYAIVENVTELLNGPIGTGKWFGRILSDLAKIGFDAEWHYISASSIGAPQNRGRVWIIAYPCGTRMERLVSPKHIGVTGSWGWRGKEDLRLMSAGSRRADWPEPCVRRMDDGIPRGVDRYRLEALGNSIVPQIATIIGFAILESEGEKNGNHRIKTETE